MLFNRGPTHTFVLSYFPCMEFPTVGRKAILGVARLLEASRHHLIQQDHQNTIKLAMWLASMGFVCRLRTLIRHACGASQKSMKWFFRWDIQKILLGNQTCFWRWFWKGWGNMFSHPLPGHGLLELHRLRLLPIWHALPEENPHPFMPVSPVSFARGCLFLDPDWKDVPGWS